MANPVAPVITLVVPGDGDSEATDAVEPRQQKGILKTRGVSWNPDEPAHRASKTSIASSTGSGIELRNVPAERGDGTESTPGSFRKSTWSVYSMPPQASWGSMFGVLIIMKIIFIDILITGFGDAFTDIAQGVYMILEEPLNAEQASETRIMGVIVILVCWIPGIVAILHLVASHKDEFLFLPNTISAEKRTQKKKMFFLMLALCFFFYPIVPTLGYLINLCFMGSKSTSAHKVEMFAKVGHSISGCVEAPIQMVMVVFLVLKEYLPIPFQEDPRYATYEDRFGNKLNFMAQIPFLTFIFSITNILASAFTINLFNVYVGQFKDASAFYRYANLIGGHLPFFLTSISFRICAFSICLVYLDFKCIPFVIAIWFANLLIGYVTSASHTLSTGMREKMGKLKIRREKSKHITKEDVENMEKEGQKVKAENKNKERNPDLAEDTPIWLNSFLSIMVPSCYMRTVDPAAFGTEGLSDDEKKKQRKLRKAFFKSEKIFQRKVIKYQVISSTVILAVALAIVFYMVEFTHLRYNNNILNNEAFKVVLLMTTVQGVLSLVSLFFIDIYDTFSLNKTGGSNRTIPKALLTLLFTILVVSPMIAAGVFLGSRPPSLAYVSIKTPTDATVSVQLVRAKLLSAQDNSTGIEAKRVEYCDDLQINQQESFCENIDDKINKILIVNWNSTGCQDLINKEEEKALKQRSLEGTCLGFSAIIILANDDYRSSSPQETQLSSKVPVLSVHLRDTRVIMKLLEKNTTKIEDLEVGIFFTDLEGIMNDLTAEQKSTNEAGECLNCVECTDVNGPTKNVLDTTKTKETSNTNSKYYISRKDNEVKLKSELTVTCSIYGRTCSQLAVWEKNNEERINKDKNNTIKGVEIQCNPFTVEKDVAEKQTPREVNDGKVPTKQTCWLNKTSTFLVTDCEDEKLLGEHVCTEPLSEWGSWIRGTNKNDCTHWDVPDAYSWNSYRFCTRDKDNCVTREVDRRWKLERDGKGECIGTGHRGPPDEEGITTGKEPYKFMELCK